MKIVTAELVPFSSVVGQSIILKDADGRVIGQLAVMNIPPHVDYKQGSMAIGQQIADLFEDLERHKAITDNLHLLSTSNTRRKD